MSTATAQSENPAPELTPREIAEYLVEDIRQRRDEWLENEKRIYPKDHPRASDLDPGSCFRRQVLSIVKWQDAKPFSAERKARFQVGDALERQGLIELGFLGIRVTKQQFEFELYKRGTKEIAVRGKIDGIVLLELGRFVRVEVPIEIKSMHPTQFAGINSVEDMLRHKWYRKWVFQMQMYLVGYGFEVGFFWITDCLGRWKAIVIEVDYELAERCWDFAERVLEARDKFRANPETEPLPPQTENTDECEGCEFFGRACQPEIQEEGVRMYHNGTLAAALRERAALEDSGKEYARVDRKVKKWLKDFETTEELKGKKSVLVGEFLIEFEERHRSGYTVKPLDYREAQITHLSPESSAIVAVEEGGKVLDLMGALKSSLEKESAAK